MSPSTFSWLDTDDDERRRMLQVVEYFKDESTVDELGIGGIRDTIADILFPGTSVLHTRLRYLLLIPWAMAEVASGGARGDDVLAQFRREGVRTIRALLAAASDAGVDPDGVIGRQARDKLKRMPSAAYWAALRGYGIVTVKASPAGWFRQASRTAAPLDEDELQLATKPAGLHPDLPLAPGGWRERCTFDLRPEDQSFLYERLTRSCQGSLLAWLATNSTADTGDWIWEHQQLANFPNQLQGAIDQWRPSAP